MKTENQFTNPDVIFASMEMVKMVDNLFDYLELDDKFKPPLFSITHTKDKIFDVKGKFRGISSDYNFQLSIDLDNEDDNYERFGKKYFPESD